MASLEKHYGKFRIVFRFQGRKFSRSLHTKDEVAAIAARAAIENRIGLIKSKLLPPPPVDCDIFEYLVRGDCITLAKDIDSPEPARVPKTLGRVPASWGVPEAVRKANTPSPRKLPRGGKAGEQGAPGK